MTDDCTTSIAYGAVSSLARRLFAFLAREVTADAFVAISGSQFELAGFRSAGIRAGAIRELVAAGLVEKIEGARAANSFRLSDKWKQYTDANAAKAAVALAREPTRRMVKTRTQVQRSKKQVAPVEQPAPADDRTPPRKVSVWQIPWPTNPDAGL